MPYVVCTCCHLRVYTAARWVAAEACPSCGTELPRRRGTVLPAVDQPRFSSEHEEAPEPRRASDAEARRE